uniref:Threonine synthase N-terminal domain-containing protein n=1 Tax=Arcella intermedia TaxID=1963864 RepID=A0A6B2LA82_9EUKA
MFSGYAADGGMLLPRDLPHFSREAIHLWKNRSYTELVSEILAYFIHENEIPRQTLKQIVNATFQKKFPKDPLPMVQLEEGVWVAEMFHGPTGAFKDLSLCLIGSLIEYFLSKRSRNVIVVVGTSGDTGSSAIHAVKDVKNVDIFVLYPNGRISSIQEKQMATHPEPNVHVYAVDGTSDDLDVPCRNVLSDIEFRDKHHLVSINSPNVCRILVQTIHFFYIYLYIYNKYPHIKELNIAIPTGACGNLTSGYMAYLMGLPIHLIASVNENDIVNEWINTGIFTLKGRQNVIPTISPAVDILVVLSS